MSSSSSSTVNVPSLIEFLFGKVQTIAKGRARGKRRKRVQPYLVYYVLCSTRSICTVASWVCVRVLRTGRTLIISSLDDLTHWQNATESCFLPFYKPGDPDSMQSLSVCLSFLHSFHIQLDFPFFPILVLLSQPQPFFSFWYPSFLFLSLSLEFLFLCSCFPWRSEVYTYIRMRM